MSASPSTAAPPIGVVGTARWAWRQLTSMRVALLLLLLLAVGAIPGSVLPQRGADPAAVAAWTAERPALGALADRLSLFDVYAAPWFAAIYLALFVSLVGCILPRTAVHARAVRARPPRAPRRLDRLPASVRTEAPEHLATPALRAAAEDVLRRRRYRVADDDGSGGHPGALGVAGEKGHWRETGNLVFHLALVVVLVAVAAGSLWGYKANVLLVEGRGFANSVVQYDSLDAGPLVDAGDLAPFTVRLDRFTMRFVATGPGAGTPEAFVADVRVRDAPGAPERRDTIAVNDPLTVDGTLVHALNPGYAGVVTVRDAAGEVVFSEPVPFLPQDAQFSSTGVVKVPLPGEDVALQGVLLPTAVVDEEGPRSVSPQPLDPALFFTAYRGDLGIDDGSPQSVFRLDTSGLRQLEEDGEPFRAAIGVGSSVDLPGGGSVSLDGVRTWVNVQVSRPVGDAWALAGVVAAIAGLALSMQVRRRRVWVRVLGGPGSRTVVEVAGLDRSPGGDLSAEVRAVLADVLARAGGDAPRQPGDAAAAPPPPVPAETPTVPRPTGAAR